MEINIPQEGPFIPSVTFVDVGQGLDYALISSDRIQSRNYDTGEPDFWGEGDPKMETANVGIVIKGNAQIGSDNEETGNRDYRDLVAGELIKVFMKSDTEKAWWAAAKVHGTVNVGDMVRDIHDSTRPAKNPKHSPVKLHTIALSRETDPAIRARAEDEAKGQASATATPVAAQPAEPAAAAAASQPTWGEDPF